MRIGTTTTRPASRAGRSSSSRCVNVQVAHEQLVTDVFGWWFWINNNSSKLVLFAHDLGLAVCQSILSCGQSPGGATPVTRAPKWSRKWSRWRLWSLRSPGCGGQTASSLVAAQSAHGTQGRGHHQDLAAADRLPTVTHPRRHRPVRHRQLPSSERVNTGQGQPASVHRWEQSCPVEPDPGDAISKHRTLVRFQSACRRSDHVDQV